MSKYISLIYALNLPCSLDTTGDWHYSSLNWSKAIYLESNGSFFGDYGIEKIKMPYTNESVYSANTIRACLDLLYVGNYSTAQGMRNDFICNDRYDMEVFKKVIAMKSLPNWDKIDNFMNKEYEMDWLNYKGEHYGV